MSVLIIGGGPGVSPGSSRTLVTHAPGRHESRNCAGENMVIADALICISSLTCLYVVQVNAWVGLWPKFDPSKNRPHEGDEGPIGQIGEIGENGPQEAGQKNQPHAGWGCVKKWTPRGRFRHDPVAVVQALVFPPCKRDLRRHLTTASGSLPDERQTSILQR